MALLTLYTVAALLSRDPHGRKLAMVTAVVGIVYQLGGLPLGVAMARQAATEGVGVLSQIVIESGREPAGFTAAQLPHLMVVPAISRPACWAPSPAWCCCITSAAGAAARSMVSIRPARTSTNDQH